MSKKRYISTEFWRDHYIDSLDPSEKLLFLYLICNPATNLCGIYELPLRIIASDTGFVSSMLEKMFEKFAKNQKAYYINGWVVLPNAPKHQDLSNEKITKGIEREITAINKDIIVQMSEKGIPYGYPIYEQSYLTKLNLTKPNGVSEPFSLKDELEKMKNDPKIHIRLLALFFYRKKLNLASKEELQEAIKRHVKAAVSVSKFESQKVLRVFEECDEMEKKEGIKYTLETVLKLLTK